MNKYDLSVIIIYHNASEHIEKCEAELRQALGGLSSEIIYVDNASTDNSIFRLQQSEEPVTRKIIPLAKKVSWGTALLVGVQQSQGRYILTMDVVLSVDPQETEKMLNEISQGYDFVNGWRQRDHLPASTRARSYWINRTVSALTGLYLQDYGTPLRLIDRGLFERMNFYTSLYAFLPIFAHLGGGRVSEIPVTYRPDYYMQAEYTPSSFLQSVFSLLQIWFISRFESNPFTLFGNLGLLGLGIFGLLSVAGLIFGELGLLLFGLVFFFLACQSILLGLTLQLLIYLSPKPPLEKLIIQTDPKENQ